VIQDLSGSWCIKGTGESMTRVDSLVPLMHRDPDRSWITDPDPNHPKGTQPLSSLEHCPPQLISIPYAFSLAAQCQLSRCTKLSDHLLVQEIFCFHFFSLLRLFPIKRLRLSRFNCMFVNLFCFLYNCSALAYNLVPRAFCRPFCRGLSILDRKQ